MAVWLPGFWFRCPLFLSLVWSSTGPSSSVWNKREGYSHPLLPHNHREKARSLFLLRAMLALVCSQPLLYWAMFFWYLICPAFLLAHIAQNNGYYCDISHVHIMYFDSISLPSLLPFTPPPNLALLLMPNNPPPPYVLDVFICSLVSTDERKQARVTFLSLAYFTSHEHIQLHFPGNGMIQSSLLLDDTLLCTWTSSYLSIPLLTHPQADSIFCLLWVVLRQMGYAGICKIC